MRTSRTIILLTFIAAFSVFAGDIISWFRGYYWSFQKTETSPQYAVFLGHWFGNSGTIIEIAGDWKANYRDQKYHLRSATATIEGIKLVIRMPGFERAFTINDPPRLHQDGFWRMRLDGELFVRESQDILVDNQETRPRFKS